MGRRRKIEALRAIAYIRVSTDDQHNGPDAQRGALSEYAQRHNIRIARVIEDIGTSGGLPLHERTRLLEAIDLVKSQRAGLLLVAKRDRLARDSVVATLLGRELERVGARVVSCDGVGNDGGPEGTLMRTMVDAFAEFERGLIRARTKAALQAKGARGERVGQVPYGYRVALDGRNLEPLPEEQAIVARIRTLRKEGFTHRAIVERLTEDGVRPRGERWHLATIQRLLARA